MVYSRWEGTGIDEVGIEKSTNTLRVRVNPKYFRPTEVVSIYTYYMYLSEKNSFHIILAYQL